MGGLSKKAYQFDLVVKKSGLAGLRLDAGALLFKGTRLTPGKKEEEKLTARAIVEAYNAMGIEAVGIAARDLAAGEAFLGEMVKASDFTWLSANLVRGRSLRPAFTPYVLLPVGDLTVAVTALTSPNLPPAVHPTLAVMASDMAMERVIKAIGDRSDLLILLSNLAPAKNKLLAARYPQIKIILQAGVSTVNMPPRLVANTVVAQTAGRGKYLGIIEIDWQAGGHWGERKDEALRKKKAELDRLDWQLGRFAKYKDPVRELKGRSGELRRYLHILDKRRSVAQEIRRLEKEAAQEKDLADRYGALCTYRNRFVPLRSNLPDRGDIVEIVNRLNDQLMLSGRKKAAGKKIGNDGYTGWRRCAKCHPGPTATWRKTAHFTAYETLVAKKRQFNLDCVPCHVTGVSMDEAARALRLPGDRRQVGCESCHGAGASHAADPQGRPLEAHPRKTVCLNCHTEEHDTDFDYLRDAPLVHPDGAP